MVETVASLDPWIDAITSTPALLEARAASNPDATVVRFEDSSLTYGELARRVAACAGVLGRRADRGDRVVTMLPNRLETVVVWFGLASLGVIEVALDPGLSGPLLVDQLDRSGCRIVIVDEGSAPAAEAACAELARSIQVVQIDDLSESSQPSSRRSLSPAATDTALILYTSGTTGRSKGVVLSHRTTFTLARAIVQYAGLREGDVLFTAFPLFHIAARFVSVVAAMLCGGHVVVHRRFPASRFWEMCREEGVTAIHYLGTVPMMLWRQPPRPADRDHRVRVAYGAGMPAGIWDDFERRFGVRVYELYGSTEQGVTAMTSATERRPGTCGRPVPWVDLEIHDEADRRLSPGVDGEIVVRPRRPGVMFDGYDGMADATVAAFRNLWFHTGDAGRLDADGYLVFSGRLKDSIRRRGENVSAWEVEHLLFTHPAVADVAVVGVPSDLGEEEVMAVIVPAGRLEPAELARHAAQLLPRHAVPRYIRFVEALPMTPSERVAKAALRDEGVTADTWDREA